MHKKTVSRIFVFWTERKSIYLNLSGLFHYGTDTPISRFEFAKLVAEKFNYDDKLVIPVKLDEIDFIAERPSNTGLISSKISKHIEVDIDNINYVLKILSKNS